ncbi:MAG: hypothetical protein QOC60_1330 [Frankiaceae bacterium]|jgi:dienelactone hydrolase|nr:hypothetical protein [Frankiaceae bacterium]
MTQTSTPPVPTLAELIDSVPLAPGAVIETAAVDYDLDGVALQGFVAADTASPTRRPGVLLIHDWLGLGENTETRAVMLARLGYVALAADVYGRDVRPDNSEAPSVAGPYYADIELWRARMAAGLDQLLAHPLVDPQRVAVIGYCFGGRGALELAQARTELVGTVAFHPTLAPMPDAARVTAKVLVLGGDADPLISDDAVVAFKQSLRGTPVDWQFVTYSGAMHGFTIVSANSPEHGTQYQAAADRRSWVAMREFFDEVFA